MLESPALIKNIPEIEKPDVMHEILMPAGIILAIILAGVGTGYLINSRSGSIVGGGGKNLPGEASVVQNSNEVGIKDEKAFSDNAVGKMEVNNDSKGEGSHKLIRPGGASQTAYLTSSVIDLNQFTGKRVQVWGETFAAQKVGWFLDVGRVKLLDSCPAGL